MPKSKKRMVNFYIVNALGKNLALDLGEGVKNWQFWDDIVYGLSKCSILEPSLVLYSCIVHLLFFIQSTFTDLLMDINKFQWFPSFRAIKGLLNRTFSFYTFFVLPLFLGSFLYYLRFRWDKFLKQEDRTTVLEHMNTIYGTWSQTHSSTDVQIPTSFSYHRVFH